MPRAKKSERTKSASTVSDAMSAARPEPLPEFATSPPARITEAEADGPPPIEPAPLITDEPAFADAMATDATAGQPYPEPEIGPLRLSSRQAAALALLALLAPLSGVRIADLLADGVDAVQALADRHGIRID